MSRRKLHPALEHLSNAEIELLTKKYLYGIKVSELLIEFNLKCAPSQLRGTLPPRTLEESCPVCGSPMVQDVPLRGYGLHNIGRSIYCSECLHEEVSLAAYMHCKEVRARAAVEQKVREEAAIPQVVKAGQAHHSCSSHSVDRLPLFLAVAFLAFARSFPINRKGFYNHVKASPVPFAPTTPYKITLLNSLTQSGLISVQEQSEEDSSPYERSQLNFALGDVYWTGNIDQNLKLAEDIEGRALAGNWPPHWRAEVEETWLNLALAECREFYDYCLDIRGFHVQSDQALTVMLKNILRDFSVAQCYRIIWEGAKTAADLLVRKKINREHAGDCMVSACQQWADAARAEGYPVKRFERHLDLPRSMMSYVLFDVILKIGERGFTEPIG